MNAGGKTKKIQMGNAELSRLWNLTDNHEVLVKTAGTPDLDDFLSPILNDKPSLLKEDKVSQSLSSSFFISFLCSLFFLFFFFSSLAFLFLFLFLFIPFLTFAPDLLVEGHEAYRADTVQVPVGIIREEDE